MLLESNMYAQKITGMYQINLAKSMLLNHIWQDQPKSQQIWQD